MTDRTRSYPSTASRVFAFAAVIAIWTVLGARSTHQGWAQSKDIWLPVFLVSAGLVALSKMYNIEVKIRPPRDDRERAYVHRLSVMKGIGSIIMLGSVIWVFAVGGSLLGGFILPFCAFVISGVLQIIAEVSYRPFVMSIDQP